MPHPLMYVLGDTQNIDFPLILTIGREPNEDEALDNSIGVINNEEFKSMSGGVWVTAYTQIAKISLGRNATARQLKDICFEKNISPIIFTNAFPMAIPNSINNKVELRNKLIDKIPAHIISIFDKQLIDRVQLVIHHGSNDTTSSKNAAELIMEECAKRNILYYKSPFFFNRNSLAIQNALNEAAPKIQEIIAAFMKVP